MRFVLIIGVEEIKRDEDPFGQQQVPDPSDNIPMFVRNGQRFSVSLHTFLTETLTSEDITQFIT